MFVGRLGGGRLQRRVQIGGDSGHQDPEEAGLGPNLQRSELDQERVVYNVQVRTFFNTAAHERCVCAHAHALAPWWRKISGRCCEITTLSL